MASKTPKLGGYDYHFVKDPPDDLICLICTFVAKDPQQVTCCGKIFCRVCLTGYKKYSKCCVQCRKLGGSSFVDQRSERNIKQLKVKCSNDSNGCRWVGELRSHDEHHTKCQYVHTACINGCGKEVLHRDMLEHLAYACANRTVNCLHCRKEGKQHEIMGIHQQACPHIEVTCHNKGCTAQVARIKLPRHFTSCQYERVCCKYEVFGCTTTVLRKDKELHENDLKLHFHLATETISKLQVRMKSVESFTLGHSVFKLQRYSTYKKECRTFYSPPFYSHPGGYKLRIDVQSNGATEAAFGTHMSVYVYFMTGDNDDNLVWPFRGEVKIEILNQEEDRNHHTQKLVYNKTKDDGDNRRVVGRKISPSGFGKPKFISKTKLEQNPQYTVGDSLYFRVTVTPQTPPKPWLTCTV